MLEEKFPHKKSKRTIYRTFKNISNYIDAKFRNRITKNGIVYKNKIAAYRIEDFEEKMFLAESNLSK